VLHRLHIGVVPAYLLICLVIGGASAAGYWANMVLQLLALPIICWALLVRRGAPISKPSRQIIFIALIGIAVVLAQLVPLPPAMWASLPGREHVADGFAALRLPLPWMPISLDPGQTLASLLWTLPALAVLLGMVRLGGFKPKWIAWAVIVVTAAAVVLGALQILGGPKSRWEIYEITNSGSATGFFANSNHMATLLLVSIPLLAALYLDATKRGKSARAAYALLVTLAGALAVILVGLAINGSLAGIGLSVPVVGATLLMVLARKRRIPAWSALIVLAVATAPIYVIFKGPFGNNLVGAEASSSGSRQESFGISSQAASDFMPMGSGLGTFQRIYRLYEDPQAVDPVYMNHVHGDYIEFALEAGLPGLLVLLIFFGWWARRAFIVFRAEERDFFATAAVIASGAILAHSIVDYPIRTAAISAVFAACCALMAEARPRAQKALRARGAAGRHLSAD
jgi:O-antigen ligase